MSSALQGLQAAVGSGQTASTEKPKKHLHKKRQHVSVLARKNLPAAAVLMSPMQIDSNSPRGRCGHFHPMQKGLS